MEKKIIDGYEIRSINSESLARYISKVFSSDIYVEIIKNFNTREDAISFYKDISKILFAYVCSTGDIYVSTAYKIMKDFFQSNLDIYNFYFKKVLPISLSRLGYDNKVISIKQMITILDHLYLNSKNNQFFTHSFNGSLYPIINKEGLDGDKVLFESEWEELWKISDVSIPNHKLFFTQLGGHTMEYALYSPESLHLLLSTANFKMNDNELLSDYYMRCLTKLTNNLDSNNYDKIIKAGKTIIDFYCSTNKACIAIMGQDYEYRKFKHTPNFTFNMYVELSKLRITLMPLLNQNNDLIIVYNAMLNSLKDNNSDCLDKLISFKGLFEKHYPNNSIIAKCLRDTFKKMILDKCLNNFTHDEFGEEIEVKNNKVDRTLFSIARFINVNDVYISKYKEISDKKVRM